MQAILDTVPATWSLQRVFKRSIKYETTVPWGSCGWTSLDTMWWFLFLLITSLNSPKACNSGLYRSTSAISTALPSGGLPPMFHSCSVSRGPSLETLKNRQLHELDVGWRLPHQTQGGIKFIFAIHRNFFSFSKIICWCWSPPYSPLVLVGFSFSQPESWSQSLGAGLPGALRPLPPNQLALSHCPGLQPNILSPGSWILITQKIAPPVSIPRYPSHPTGLFLSFLKFFTLWKYDNTFTGDLKIHISYKVPLYVCSK